MEAKNLVGTTIDGRYEITRIIGQGGMGAVFEAQHAGTGRRVAVKVISTGDVTKDAQLVGRFQREAKAAGAIDTQHICQVLDTGTDGVTGWPYMVMEYMVGEDVQQLVRRVGPVTSDLALRIVAQSCLGLQKAHDGHVVHRDIKPANLFLARSDGGNVLVKLLDFGIAKVKMETASEAGDAGLTRTGTMLGSPLYMSPEQARGMKTIDHRADIWSLGVVLYELLSGRTPYHHIEALGELIIAICSEPPRPIQDFAPWLTPEVAAIVHKALKANVNERFQTAAEMLDAIKPLLPNGYNIDEGMLIGLSQTQREQVAKRLTLPPPEDQRIPTNVPAQSVPPPAQGAGTTGGISTPTERNPQLPQKSNMPLILAGAVLSVALLGGVGYKLVASQQQAAPTSNQAPASPQPTTPPTTTASAESPITPVASSVAVTPAPQASASEEPTDEKTVYLGISPDDAKVTVDGEEVAVNKDDHTVEITGVQGTRHKVVVELGEDKIEKKVIITDTGADPPFILLQVKGRPPPKAPTNVPGPGTGPKPPGSGPGIDREFGKD
ncbi:MAG: serine/threonine-protein kinase [Polyangiaceae bacterium]